MATIYTRAAKGSALTWTEGDANITNLNTDKIEAVVDDTSPSLGGNLDVAGYSIVSTANGNITISPNGTGQIVLDGQTWPAAAPATNNQYLKANADGSLGWTDSVTAKTITELVKNASGGELTKGTPVYQIGVSGNTITVGAARADDPTKLAIGVLNVTLANDAEGDMIVLGEIKGVNTSGFTSGDKVYLGATGGYTNVAPTSASVAQQFLGIVNRVDSSNGSGFITGTLTPDAIRYNSSTSVYEAWNGTSWEAITEAPSVLTGTVTDIDTGRTPNTITLSNYTGIAVNDEITFTGTDVTSAGLSTSATYYIAASVGSGAFEITDTFNGSPITITDVDPITSFNYSVTLATEPELTLNDLGDVNITGTPGDGNVLTYNSSSSSWQASAPAASGIASVSADTNPQLGGNLNVNGFNISNTAGDTKVSISSLKYPNADGTNGQVLSTDGAGNIVFSTVTSGISNLVEDTTPQLGGNLDVNGNSIVSVSNGNIAITPDGTGKIVLKNINYYESPVYDLGTTSGTITPNVTNGNVQKITLNGNLTFSAFSSPIAGQSLTLIVTQDGTGNRTLTSTMKFSNEGYKTLSTAGNSVDIINVFYDGTTYWASLGKRYL